MSHYAEYRAVKPVETMILPDATGTRARALAEVILGKVGDRWLIGVRAEVDGRKFGGPMGYWASTGPTASWASRAEALDAAVARLMKYSGSATRDKGARAIRNWAAGLLTQSGDLFAFAK